MVPQRSLITASSLFTLYSCAFCLLCITSATPDTCPAGSLFAAWNHTNSPSTPESHCEIGCYNLTTAEWHLLAGYDYLCISPAYAVSPDQMLYVVGTDQQLLYANLSSPWPSHGLFMNVVPVAMALTAEFKALDAVWFNSTTLRYNFGTVDLATGKGATQYELPLHSDDGDFVQSSVYRAHNSSDYVMMLTTQSNSTAQQAASILVLENGKVTSLSGHNDVQVQLVVVCSLDPADRYAVIRNGETLLWAQYSNEQLLGERAFSSQQGFNAYAAACGTDGETVQVNLWDGVSSTGQLVQLEKRTGRRQGQIQSPEFMLMFYQ